MTSQDIRWAAMRRNRAPAGEVVVALRGGDRAVG